MCMWVLVTPVFARVALFVHTVTGLVAKPVYNMYCRPIPHGHSLLPVLSLSLSDRNLVFYVFAELLFVLYAVYINVLAAISICVFRMYSSCCSIAIILCCMLCSNVTRAGSTVVRNSQNGNMEILS